MSIVELSQETVNEFRDQGATVLRGVFREWVEPLRAGVEKNLADPSPLVKYYTGEGEQRPFLRGLLQLESHPRVPRLCAPLSGGRRRGGAHGIEDRAVLP